MTCHAHALAASRMFLCQADVDLIRETVAKLPPDSVVIDLGAGSGTTALSVFAERQDVEVVTIEHDEDNLAWARKALDNAKVPLAKWRGIRADSAFRGGEGVIRYGEPMIVGASDTSLAPMDIRLVILDTSHEYDDTLAEINYWLPKLAPGGYMMFHDYDAKEAPCHYPGVKQAVDPHLAMGTLVGVKRQGWSLLTRKPELSA